MSDDARNALLARMRARTPTSAPSRFKEGDTVDPQYLQDFDGAESLVTLTVDWCLKCKSKHESVTFTKLERPYWSTETMGGREAACLVMYHGTCPTTGTPIKLGKFFDVGGTPK